MVIMQEIRVTGKSEGVQKRSAQTSKDNKHKSSQTAEFSKLSGGVNFLLDNECKQ